MPFGERCAAVQGCGRSLLVRMDCPMPREAAFDKARGLLAEGRVSILRASHEALVGRVRGDSAHLYRGRLREAAVQRTQRATGAPPNLHGEPRERRDSHLRAPRLVSASFRRAGHLETRDRIVELRRVPAAELRANPKSWRRRPAGQARALRSVLEQVGYADALLARQTPDGLELIDGHLRAETTPEQEVLVLVLDVHVPEAA